jgi:hypothetical protein
VKTTLEIPDETFRQAKVRAALRNIPLRQFVTEAVEEKLAKSSEDPATPPWMAGFGDLADLADESRRLMALVAEEFEAVDSEDEA